MKAIIGGVYNRRKIPCYIYGFGRRIHPSKCQISSESLNWCKLLVDTNDKRNFGNNFSHHDSPAFRGLDLRRLSTCNSISHTCVSNCFPSTILPKNVTFLTPASLDLTFRLMSTNTEASSKVEETVRRLKEKHDEKLKEIHKIQDIDMRVKSVIELDQETDKEVQRIKEQSKTVEKSAKKSLWQRFVDELRHYKSGFVLLFLDIRVVSKILWKMARGNNLTRRENRQLVRTVGDVFRLVPFSVFIIVPFMEFLLPIALKLFPGMLPTTFTTKSERDNKFRKRLVAKIEYAKFLQKTLDEMAPTDTKSSRSSQSARDFVDFFKKIRESGKAIDNEQILKFSKLFEDEITLDNMTRTQLAAICRMLELPTVGTKAFLAFSIEMKLRNLKADDRVIRREGIENMTVLEMQQASRERGMRALGLTKDQLITQLKEWLELSLTHKVPPSLLLLSRTLYLPQNLDPISQLAATISTLPESAASRATAEIASKEGKTRNVVKLELIKEEEKKIAEEAKEEKARIEKEKLEVETKKAKQAILEAEEKEATIIQMVDEATTPLKEKEVLVDSAPILTDSTAAKVLEDVQLIQKEATPNVERRKTEAIKPAPIATPDLELSYQDFADLKVALETLGKTSNIDTIDDLKEELEDYKEDVEDLQAVQQIVDRSGLKESRGARLLFSKVNKMLNKVDRLAKTKKIKTEEGKAVAEDSSDPDINIVTINELIKAVQTSKSGADNTKVEALIEVLTLMDEDADGVIKVDQVIDVIELLGTAQAKFSAKSIRQIVETLAKEDLLQVEENIEQSMSLHSDVDDSFSIDAAYDQNLHDLEEAAKSNSDEIKAKDTAMNMNEINSNYDMQDNAKNMNEEATGDTPGNKNFPLENQDSLIEEDKESSKIGLKLNEKKKGDSMDLK